MRDKLIKTSFEIIYFLVIFNLGGAIYKSFFLHNQKHLFIYITILLVFSLITRWTISSIELGSMIMWKIKEQKKIKKSVIQQLARERRDQISKALKETHLTENQVEEFKKLDDKYKGITDL